MSSRDEFNPQLHRFFHDDESDRTVARFHVGSSSTPRRLPSIAGFDDLAFVGGAAGATAYGSPEYPDYTMASTSSWATDTYADDEYYQTPAHFMHPPHAGAGSQHAGSSSRSGYTSSSTVYPAPSTRSSEASSFTPTIFTRGSIRTSGGGSSQPPERAHITNFNQALVAGLAAMDYGPVDHNIPPAVPTAESHPLWCELCITRNCDARFRFNQTREWIDHHCRHLGHRFPAAELACWFCDYHTPFGGGGARTNEERRADFVDRMDHIRDHIFSEDRTRDEMRPDFAMINHLADNRVISDGVRGFALGYSELPEALRIPGSSGSVSGSAAQMAYDQEQQRRHAGPSLAHDLDRERRHQRRRGGQPSRQHHRH